MPLYDYFCTHCRKSFEEIRAFSSRDGGACRNCGKEELQRKITRFRIGKQGDLRETTEFHGCHSAVEESHGHQDRGHTHGHSHGPGCGHGAGPTTAAVSEHTTGSDADSGGEAVGSDP